MSQPGSRELEVIRLVADGLTNAQIAERLGISWLTVKTHLANASRKIGAKDRAHLVFLCMQQGLVD